MAGGMLGLVWGVAMPVFNGLLFDTSAPRLRGFNINLGLQMFQGGFFLGPVVGAWMVAHWGFTVLFQVCAALSLASGVFTLIAGSKRQPYDRTRP
jgi:MFS family permease